MDEFAGAWIDAWNLLRACCGLQNQNNVGYGADLLLHLPTHVVSFGTPNGTPDGARGALMMNLRSMCMLGGFSFCSSSATELFLAVSAYAFKRAGMKEKFN